MNVLKSLSQSRELSDNEHAIITYIMNNPDEVSKISSRELARRAYVSPSSVLRLCKTLGYCNYASFRASFVSNLKSVKLDEHAVEKDDNELEVSSKVLGIASRILAETNRLMSYEMMQRIEAELSHVERIDFIARDINADIAAYASHNLMVAGRLSSIYSDLDKMLYYSLHAQAKREPGIAVVAISKHGQDAPIVDCAERLTASGVVTICVTADENSPLARACLHVLKGFYFEDLDQYGDVAFAESAKYLLDVIYVDLLAHDLDNATRLDKAYDAIYHSRSGIARNR